jgi:hypothetical protein
MPTKIHSVPSARVFYAAYADVTANSYIIQVQYTDSNGVSGLSISSLPFAPSSPGYVFPIPKCSTIQSVSILDALNSNATLASFNANAGNWRDNMVAPGGGLTQFNISMSPSSNVVVIMDSNVGPLL